MFLPLRANFPLIGMMPAILLGALLLGLSGCATQPTPPEPLTSAQLDKLTEHQQQLDEINSWKLKGRLAISYNGESWNASIHWQKRPGHYDIQLYLPLGQGSLQLTEDNGRATLSTSDGERFEAESGENLFYQQFGLIFPVTALHDWVIGRPAVASTTSSLWLQRVDGRGRMVELDQDSWNLRLLSYQDLPIDNPDIASQGISLPQKIFLKQNGNSVRLVVQEWQLND